MKWNVIWWLASLCQSSPDESCRRVKEGTEHEVWSVVGLHAVIIHLHVSVEARPGADVEAMLGDVWGSVGSVYNVSDAQAVEGALVTSRQPA